jgi:hypothetical protein
MGVMEFQVCRRGREARWVVTLGDKVYGAYLDKEQALLDAVDAARERIAVTLFQDWTCDDFDQFVRLIGRFADGIASAVEKALGEADTVHQGSDEIFSEG